MVLALKSAKLLPSAIAFFCIPSAKAIKNQHSLPFLNYIVSYVFLFVNTFFENYLKIFLNKKAAIAPRFIITEVLSESARSAFSSKTDEISNKKGKNLSFCVKPARVFKFLMSSKNLASYSL